MERAAITLNKETSPPRTDETPRTASLNRENKPTDGALDIGTINTALGLNNLVDFSLIDAVSGQDIFGHIDPSFNLDAVEDALEANLDIGLPLNWGDWGQLAT